MPSSARFSNDEIVAMATVLNTLTDQQREVMTTVVRTLIEGGYNAIEVLLHAVTFLQPLLEDNATDSEGVESDSDNEAGNDNDGGTNNDAGTNNAGSDNESISGYGSGYDDDMYEDPIAVYTTREQRRDMEETYRRWRCNLCESINVRSSVCTTCGWDSD
ncbi:hypothetical protein VNI00_003667 [Paramarasmius palmivorus]|uniref:RanBP2-type domain-containing protein n=1 Tax=Paramarasmius palmivorus TaxID=297713 RepID=A0AAW0DPM5_9AGAR